MIVNQAAVMYVTIRNALKKQHRGHLTQLAYDQVTLKLKRSSNTRAPELDSSNRMYFFRVICDSSNSPPGCRNMHRVYFASPKDIVDISIAPPSGSIANIPRVQSLGDMVSSPSGKIIDINEPEPDENRKLDELIERFESLETIANGFVDSNTKGLIISGSPGISKSYTVTRALESRYNSSALEVTLRAQADADFVPPYQIVRGGRITPVRLFEALYQCRRKHQILVLDDCDSFLYEPVALNVLKGALDSNEPRIIEWRSTYTPDTDENPFRFEGGVVFITNVDLKLVMAKVNKFSAYIRPLVDRNFYVDVNIRSWRMKFLWIRHICLSKSFKSKTNSTDDDVEQALAFVQENAERLTDISVRTITRLIDIKHQAENWRTIAAFIELDR
jgi:hypothetical protein